MEAEDLLFEDSRDCARYIVNDLNEVLSLPGDSLKVIRRLAQAPRPLPADDEYKALQKILNTLVPVVAGRSTALPIEVMAVIYRLAEMIALIRDDLADGALGRLRDEFDDDPDATESLMSLHDELLSAQVRDVMVVHGLVGLVLADHEGILDLDWMNEFGTRLIGGGDPFGFDPVLTRVLLEEEAGTLLALSDTETGATRYVVATSDPVSEDPAWLSRLGPALVEDVRLQQEAGEDIEASDTFVQPIFLSVAGDTAGMLAELAHQLWQTTPGTLLVVVAENEADHHRFVEAVTEGVLPPDPSTRILH